ncbi:DUF2807 domain-containing protein [Fulvivirga sp. RKSG066]|uniref:head GIN domain-containing protein n=1 Tax=Fulvivirga aurantia TaxID=2529383 RepID=UPI0012BC1329|nr:head GIN domain-containing protein [Fulvivirga aurantia]MTI21168.1 DUF2807 domain-containing protein [Fulvivirga aurantia]
MKKTQILIAIVLLLSLAGCDNMVQEKGNGNIISKDIEVEDFEELDISGNFEINLIKGSKPALTITMDENLFEYVETENRGDQLQIESTRSLRSDEGLRLDITYSRLTSIEVGGAAAIMSDDVVEGDYLNIIMSGAGTIDLKVMLKALKIVVSGAGSVDLSGQVLEQNISMSGAGDVDASRLVSESCEIELSGVGSARLYVTETLDAQVSGVGGITYAGNPSNVKTDVSGLGEISKMKEDEDK